MTESYTVKVKKYDRTDPRLGRIVIHDSRSLSYQAPARDPHSLTSIRHQRYIPTLDQGNLGSCVGNASVGNLGTGAFWNELPVRNLLSETDAATDEVEAVAIYSEATTLDPFAGAYPPDDTGTNGLSAAKVMKAKGLISGYLHATTLEALLTALSIQPVMVGTEWRSDMFNPDADGRIHISGDVEGGHEYVLDELDVENARVWLHNSWNDDWGIQGRAYLTWGDLDELLHADGDCTVLVPISSPAPEPTPPTPPPVPQPTPDPVPPEPQPSPTPRTKEEWAQLLREFIAWYDSDAS